MATCIRCNRCLEVCPYASIQRGGWGVTIGTPFVLPEARACYLCIACSRLCPTGSLDNTLREPERVKMGRAKIDPSICYGHLFFDRDVLPDDADGKIGAMCNTCYNVCPFPDKAIMLEDNLLPVILEGCVGCGICVERCPTRPRRAINVIPTGMGRIDEAGFAYRKAQKYHEGGQASDRSSSERALKGESLLERKQRIEGGRHVPEFEFPYDQEEDIEGSE